MNRAQRIIVVACLGIGLFTAAAPARAQTSALPDQITQHEQKLAAARAARNRRQEGLELITLGYLYRQAGQMQPALDRLNAALTLSQNAGNQIGQAMALNTMGRIYCDMGQEDKALDLSGRALSLYHSLGMRQGEANTLNNMGRAYDELGKREEALKCLNDALAIWRDQGGAESQAPAGSARQAAMKRQDGHCRFCVKPTAAPAKRPRSTISGRPIPTWAGTTRRWSILTRPCRSGATKESKAARH